jgi:uncharacterized protein (TIGR00255 family)
VPSGYEAVGEELRQRLTKALSRGQVQVNLTLTRATSAPKLRINREALAVVLDALRAVDPPEGVRPASMDGILGLRGVVEVDEETGDAGELLADLAAAAERAAVGLAEARRSEGRALREVIGGQLDAMTRHVEAAEAHPGRAPDAIRARIASQVAQLVEAHSALDPARLHQEAVLVATRADIREELDRLKAHVDAARELLAQGGPVGRRLDFLAQEFGREANTLCAKAVDVTLSRIGLELKGVVEQFREQVQNVE